MRQDIRPRALRGLAPLAERSSVERQVPDPRRVIVAHGHDTTTVSAERRAPHGSLMLERRRQCITKERVPHPRRVIVAGSHDQAAIEAERGAPYGSLMFQR